MHVNNRESTKYRSIGVSNGISVWCSSPSNAISLLKSFTATLSLSLSLIPPSSNWIDFSSVFEAPSTFQAEADLLLASTHPVPLRPIGSAADPIRFVARHTLCTSDSFPWLAISSPAELLDLSLPRLGLIPQKRRILFTAELHLDRKVESTEPGNPIPIRY